MIKVVYKGGTFELDENFSKCVVLLGENMIGKSSILENLELISSNLPKIISKLSSDLLQRYNIEDFYNANVKNIKNANFENIDFFYYDAAISKEEFFTEIPRMLNEIIKGIISKEIKVEINFVEGEKEELSAKIVEICEKYLIVNRHGFNHPLKKETPRFSAKIEGFENFVFFDRLILRDFFNEYFWPTRKDKPSIIKIRSARTGYLNRFSREDDKMWSFMIPANRQSEIVYNQFLIYSKIFANSNAKINHEVNDFIYMDNTNTSAITFKKSEESVPKYSFMQLSSGFKSLAIIKMASTLNSPLLFIDEPEAHLSLTWQKRIIKFIQNSKTVFFVSTHSDLFATDFAALIPAEVILMKEKISPKGKVSVEFSKDGEKRAEYFSKAISEFNF